MKNNLEKRLQKAKKVQEELREFGVDNAELMDSLILQTLMEISGRQAWLLGVASIGMAILISVAIAVWS